LTLATLCGRIRLLMNSSKCVTVVPPASLPLAFFFAMKKLLMNVLTALLYAADQLGLRRGWWR